MKTITKISRIATVVGFVAQCVSLWIAPLSLLSGAMTILSFGMLILELIEERPDTDRDASKVEPESELLDIQNEFPIPVLLQIDYCPSGFHRGDHDMNDRADFLGTLLPEKVSVPGRTVEGVVEVVAVVSIHIVWDFLHTFRTGMPQSTRGDPVFDIRDLTAS